MPLRGASGIAVFEGRCRCSNDSAMPWWIYFVERPAALWSDVKLVKREIMDEQPQVGLTRYDAMCTAIAACYSVDEAKELRDKARALEVYAQQARNVEAERKACEIRIRAERRAGELLREMRDRGERRAGESGRPEKASRETTLSDLKITRDQSSKWQQLAAVPADEFEQAISCDGPKPTTEGIINAKNPRPKLDEPRIDPDALWLWGRLRDFEMRGLFNRESGDLVSVMTDSMRDDCHRIIPRVLGWLRETLGVDHGNGRAA